MEAARAAGLDVDKLTYEIFSILESEFLFSYDDPKLFSAGTSPWPALPSRRSGRTLATAKIRSSLARALAAANRAARFGCKRSAASRRASFRWARAGKLGPRRRALPPVRRGGEEGRGGGEGEAASWEFWGGCGGARE
ncbi:unnamed protein product [Urochloa humidicola]